jgi:hypothetical protein
MLRWRVTNSLPSRAAVVVGRDGGDPAVRPKKLGSFLSSPHASCHRSHGELFQAADQLGLEGVIGKKADSPYRAGRTPN